MAWRCRDDKNFFGKALEILNVRGLYHPVIQGYSVAHNHKEGIAQLLLMQERFLDQCGVALSCDLLTVDPVNRRRYEHLEYKPLINNRAHALGGENRILNPVVRGQYSQFLRMLSQQKDLDDLDHLATTYYLFIQDRVAEALAQLKQVKPAKLETRMQYDYFQAYGAFYEADLPKARRLATKYEEYPVDLWRDRFADWHRDWIGRGLCWWADRKRHNAHCGFATFVPCFAGCVDAHCDTWQGDREYHPRAGDRAMGLLRSHGARHGFG